MAKKLLIVGMLNVLMVYVVVMLIGCAGGMSVIPMSVKIQNADRKVEAAAMVVISNDLEPKKRRELLAHKRTLYDEAIALYIECAASDKYDQRAHFQIAQIYKNNPNVLEEVINILFYIAEADGNVSQSELDMIQHIAQIFGLNQSQFNSIKESRKGSDKLNPYIVLESKPEEDLQTIRKKYLKLSKEHHPDILMNKGVPQ